ncbi:unnamed protein product [Ascophyllum nodosum]
MAISNKQQLPMHLDKWIVTIREGKRKQNGVLFPKKHRRLLVVRKARNTRHNRYVGLTKGNQKGFFFKRLNPFCELSLGDQGPYPTSVKSNTAQPAWDESIEFEAIAWPASHPLKEDQHRTSSRRAGGDRDATGASMSGLKLHVVCFTKSSIKAPEGDNPYRASPDPEAAPGPARVSKIEIGRAEVELRVEELRRRPTKTMKVPVPLWRWSSEGCQVPAGHVTVECTFVEGIPPRHKTLECEHSTDQESKADLRAPVTVDDGGPDTNPSGVRCLGAFGDIRRLCTGSGGSVGNLGGDSSEHFLDRPYRKPAILVAVGAMIVAVLSARFAGLQTPPPPLRPMPALAPIVVPFRISAGKSRGSSTHHVRLHAEDGNVVVALGRRPPSDPDVSAATPSKAHVLWESGPIRSLELSSGGPSKKRACRLCKLHVSKDGSMLVVQGFEKLAAFSPSTVEALETIFMVDKASQE